MNGKTKIKIATCKKHEEYLYLILSLGQGVMLKQHLYRHIKRIYGFGDNTLRKSVTDMINAEIVEIIKFKNKDVLKLKKYALKYLIEQKLGQEVENHDISSINVTEKKLKKTIIINHWLLESVKDATVSNIESIREYVNICKTNTPYFYNKSENLTYYVKCLNKINNSDIKQQFENELIAVQEEREQKAKFLAMEAKKRSNPQLILTPVTLKQSGYNLNNMLNSNIYIIIGENTVTVVLIDIYKIYTKYNIAQTLLKINTYLISVLGKDGNLQHETKYIFIALTDAHNNRLEREINHAYNTIRLNPKNTYSFILQREDIRIRNLDINNTIFGGISIIF